MFRITKPRYLHYQNDQSHVTRDLVQGLSKMRLVAVATLFIYISLIDNRFLVLFVLFCFVLFCCCWFSFNLFWYFVKLLQAKQQRVRSSMRGLTQMKA